MRPLSTVTPKPMLPVADRPLAAHVADAAVAAGADELLFVVGYGADHVRAYFEDEYDGVPVRYATQSSPSGTADAVQTASDLIEGPFAVLNGDNLYDEASIVELFEHDAAVAAHRVEDPSEYGVLTTDDGAVTGIVEKPDDPPSTLANAGAYVFPESAVDELDVDPSERGERELTDVLATLVDRQEVAVVETHRWLDVARPPDLVTANELAVPDFDEETQGSVPADADTEGAVHVASGATVEPDATIEGPVLVGRGATVGSDAVVRGPAVLGPDSTLAEGASLSEAVLLEGATVDDGVQLSGVVLGPQCSLGDDAEVVEFGVEDSPGTASVVGGDAPLGVGLQYY
jgi:bifunctional UDP-N-acetylglucosamine pyrophosphorylase/glucosamine-1-phosphate N-acetyltransferase